MRVFSHVVYALLWVIDGINDVVRTTHHGINDVVRTTHPIADIRTALAHRKAH